MMDPHHLTEQVPAVLRCERERIGREYGVQDVKLFGSIARGDHHADSDVDLLVTFHRAVTLFDIIHLEDDLTALLGRRVQVSEPGALRPRLRSHVKQDSIAV